MTALRGWTNDAITLVVPHLWNSTLFLMVVLVFVFALRRRLTAGGRYSLALIGILKFAIPAAVVASPLRELLGNVLERPERLLAVPLQFFTGAAAVQTASPETRVWPAAAIAVWAAVALLVIVRSLLVHRRLITLAVKTATPPQPREVEALARAKRRAAVRQSIDIARSPLPEGPAVLRVWRPLIVLPAGCDDLSDEELESLLRHECAHVARHDNLVATIESLICALFWFHPLIWIAQRITRTERELACDEAVAGSADERDTYVTALTKFCHAAIAPRLPGVSCMATAKLKERMNHVMSYPALKKHAPSPRKVALLGAAALAVFTLGSAVVGTPALAVTPEGNKSSYALRIDATRQGSVVTLNAQVTDNATPDFVVSAPKMSFRAGEPAKSVTTVRDAAGHELSVTLDVRPDGGERIAVDATVARDGQKVQATRARILPTAKESTGTYSGQPITMSLKDADLRDVIGTFGKLTGLVMQIDPGIEGKVTVNWVNVPWDLAFTSMLDDHGLTYKTEGNVVHVTKK